MRAVFPDQSGKTFVVTGANAGLGYFTSEAIARAGGHVILGCRNAKRADAAARAIRGRVPGASVATLDLDVADSESVRAAAAELRSRGPLDGLILNAGIVHPPRQRELSADGQELVLATNYLGHFVLAAELMPALEAAPAARVISLGSVISRLMDSSLEDLQLLGGYQRWIAYAQSKIAMQVFGFELDRRLRVAGSSVASVVAHPGYSISGITPRIVGVNQPSRLKGVRDELQRAVGAQGKHEGAAPIVYAALAADVVGGQYWGPRLLLRGRPTLQRPTKTSLDTAIGARVWAESEALTATAFSLSE